MFEKTKCGFFSSLFTTNFITLSLSFVIEHLSSHHQRLWISFCVLNVECISFAFVWLIFFISFFAFFVLPVCACVCVCVCTSLHGCINMYMYKYVNSCMCGVYSYDNTNHKMNKGRRRESESERMGERVCFSSPIKLLCATFMQYTLRFNLHRVLVNWMLSKRCYICAVMKIVEEQIESI